MKWITTDRECTCSIDFGYPEPDCTAHGVDAFYGRYDNPWWGRIQIPKRVSVPA